MTMAFGNKFASVYGAADNGVWFDALADLTRKDIQDGFLTMIRDTQGLKTGRESWPPNAREFRAYCVKRLEDFGLPHAHVAYRQVKEAGYMSNMYCDHAAVYQTAVWVGYEKLTDHRGNKDEFYFNQYKTTYELLCNAVMRGLDLPARRMFSWVRESVEPGLSDLSSQAIREAIIDLGLTLQQSERANG